MPETPSAVPSSTPSRSNSLASTASSSGASLTRRPRITRKRTRTITEGSPCDDKSLEAMDRVIDISAENNTSQAVEPIARTSKTPSGLSTMHARPGLDSSWGSGIRTGLGADRSSTTLGTFGPLMDDHEIPPGDSAPQNRPGAKSLPDTLVSPPTTKGHSRHLPRLTSPPSSFKPTLTDADRARSSLRDSLMTQQSSSSSSVYPISTCMGTDSPPSPQSPVPPDRGVTVPAFEFDVPKVQEFDADDVSYRLQLLVKNSYFLPPAHSKPSPATFSSLPNSSKKAPSPTFLDLFRVGKSKSKPSSPEVANGTSPIFRVTSDATIVSGLVARDSGRPPPQAFRPPPGSQNIARVVVVREKMVDLAAAARQAEIDLGRRDFLVDRDRVPRRVKLTTFDGIVDPTEMVDVPPPSANYPLALQASALHGLGIEDSLGAAILAERLPPPDSPGQSSLDPRENAWRKALLREAVGHSLNNSRDTSSVSRSSTPTQSPLPRQSSESLRPNKAVDQQKRLLDQKILKHPIIDPMEDYSPPPPPASSALNQSASVAVVTSPDPRRLSNLALLRAETPVPQTPLCPPPRRAFGNSQFSKSQINVSPVSGDPVYRTPRKPLRRSMSSPMFSEKHGCRTNGTGTPSKTSPMPSVGEFPAASTFDNRISTITSISRYTSSSHDDQVVDDHPGRPSLAITLQSLDGQQSSSEYSQPSPTASAFRDRWSDGYYSANSGVFESPLDPPVPSHDPRSSTMSPPPRPSSSVAGISLSPPPRTGRHPLQPTSSQILAIAPTRSSSRGTVHSFTSNSTLSQSIRAPSSFFLNVSSQSFHSAFHSAPPPSSTTEFFDHIQAHTDAMHDLDESDDSASDMDPDITAVYASSPAGVKLMRLGNLSTPNVYPGAKAPYYPSVIPTERRRPVGHTAPKKPYFSSVKAAPHSLTHLSLAQHSREHLSSLPPSPGPRPVATGPSNTWRWPMDHESFQESSRRLDGLLAQHIETEKDTMKKIAETAKVVKL